MSDPKKQAPVAAKPRMGSRILQVFGLQAPRTEQSAAEASELDAQKKRLTAILPHLDSEEKHLRIGAIKSLISFLETTTKLSKADVKEAFKEGAPRVIAQPQRAVAQKVKAKKAEDPSILAVKAKYPAASQRGKDSAYAAEIKTARAALKKKG
jgi:hypothetical protein